MTIFSLSAPNACTSVNSFLSKPNAAALQIRNQSWQQDGRIDQPGPVFASRHIELLERKRAGPGFRHHVIGRVGVECGDRMVEGIIAPERNSVMRPSRLPPELDYSVARAPQVVGENVSSLLGLIFFIDAGRLELPCGFEGGRLANVQVLGIDRDAQARPAAAQLACDR